MKCGDVVRLQSAEFFIRCVGDGFIAGTFADEAILSVLESEHEIERHRGATGCRDDDDGMLVVAGIYIPSSATVHLVRRPRIAVQCRRLRLSYRGCHQREAETERFHI